MHIELTKKEIRALKKLRHEIHMMGPLGTIKDMFTRSEAFGDNVVWAQIGDEEESKYIPIAVKVEHIPFIAENTKNIGDTYFAVVITSPRKEACRDFWEYINAWTPAS